jgi:hypothetical protein
MMRTSRRAEPVPSARRISALTGLREPIVVVLLLIAFFTAISGKPLDGLFMLVVATGLAWDAARRAKAGAQAPAGGVPPVPATAAQPPAAQPPAAQPPAAQPPAAQPPAAQAPDAQARAAQAPAVSATVVRPRRPLLIITGLVAGGLYAASVGSLTRYSWPATVAVLGVGAVVVVLGWRGPRRQRPIPGKLPLPGSALWGGLLVAGGLWELAALLMQPDLTLASYAHPTISALTDPLLGTHAGRSLALAIWLALGWFLVER